jgi:hypothetical protein
MEGPALRFSHIDAENKKFKGFVDVPYKSWSTKATMSELESEMSSQLGGLRVAYIAYRGVRVRKDRQISSYIPDLKQQGACKDIRFSVHTTTGKNAFFVKTLEGNSVIVDLPLATTTVNELKAEVNFVKQIPIEYQRFQYEGKQFSDCKSLANYGVERDSTVHLLTHLRGGAPGIEFTDIQNQSALCSVPFAKTAPKWKVCTRGLNLEGKCENKACEAFGQRVICMMGFTAVNLSTDMAPCPICKERVQVKTCSFTSCSWMFEGRKVSPKKRMSFNRIAGFVTGCFAPKTQEKPVSRDIVSPWYKASNKYEFFRQKDNMVQWENLIVVAKKLPTLARNHEQAVVSVDEKCSICFHDFSGNLKTHTTPCKHTFHAECLESWLGCSATGCPICREEVVVEK